MVVSDVCSWCFMVFSYSENLVKYAFWCLQYCVQYSYRPSFGDCAAPCMYYTISPLCGLLGLGVGGLGRIAIWLPWNKGRVLITWEALQIPSKGSCMFWSTVPTALVCKCTYLLGKIDKRSARYWMTFCHIQPFFCYSFLGKDNVLIIWRFSLGTFFLKKEEKVVCLLASRA